MCLHVFKTSCANLEQNFSLKETSKEVYIKLNQVELKSSYKTLKFLTVSLKLEPNFLNL